MPSSTSPIKYRERQYCLRRSIGFLRNMALPIIKVIAYTCNRKRKSASDSPQMAINVPTTRLRMDRVIRHFPSTANSKYRRRKNIRIREKKSFTRQNSPDSKVSGFKVPTLDSGFKISGDTTKPGSFYFGFVHLCINGKTNPVLKRSGFVTNPEQFPLV